METAESLGFIQYWGASKWLDLAKGQEGELKILVSGGCDLRHILKTCLDAKEGTKLTFYVHEKSKEPFCRQLLFMLILHTVNLNFRERTDLFLDVFGNSLIREKSQSYLDFIIPYLDVFVSDSKKYQTALNKIFDLKELKFKDRDEMVEIFRSWYSSVPFQIDKLRDQRLRYHYKTRYDFRTNVIDWDYQMALKECAPIIHFYHYREWRQSGVAFESRFSTYPTPNRTLSSYLPGKKKGTHESCLVRGYWGDIIMSPYLSYGISTDVMPEKEKLFKVVNMAQSSHSVTVSEFNVQHMIQKIDNGSEYHIDFEGVQKKVDEATQKEKKGEKLEQIEEKDEEDQKEQEEDTITENKPQIVQTDSEYFISPEPLLAFQKLELKIVPIFEDIDKICSRSKFNGLFDAAFIGFFHSAYLKKPELSKILKPQAKIFVENAKFLVPLKKEERKGANENLVTAGQGLGFSVEQNIENDDYIIFKKQL